ncbi:ADOP family duplicated permease [Gemmatimonadota bacterium]
MSAGGGWKRLFRLTESAKHVRDQVDDELLFHVETLLERYLAEGMTEEEAWLEVRRQVGDLDHLRAEMAAQKARANRSSRRRLFRDGLRSDVRVGLRQFRKRPGFTSLAVLTLALGIGASTTLFSVVKDVLLDPLPYPESDRLVYVGSVLRGGVPSVFTAPEFLALHASTQTLESYAAYRYATMIVRVGARPEQFRVAAVTEDYFAVYGVGPALGRAFQPDDYRGNASPVVILSHGVWQERWGGDLEAIGSMVAPVDRPWTPDQSPLTEQFSYVVVGVMPADFPSTADFWIPERLTGTEFASDDYFTNGTHRSVGRLRSGLSLADLREETAVLAASLAVEHPEYYSGGYFEGRSIDAISLLDRTVGGYRGSTLLMFGAAGLLLLIAVANLAGLLLARALDRNQEMAIRGALGAGRGRVARLILTETMLLTLLSSAAGIAMALGGMRIFKLLAPLAFPRLDVVAVDVWAMAFAVALALLCGLLCGIAPVAVGNSKRSLVSPLQGSSRGGERKGTARLWKALVGTQVALAVYLLVGAGLLAHNYRSLLAVDPGVESEDLLLLPISTSAHSDTEESYVGFLSETIRRVGAIPGVESVSWTPDPPLYGGWWIPPVVTEGMAEDVESPSIRTHAVGPDFFPTLGIPIHRGRGIEWTDNADAEPVVVVDEVMATRFWPNEDPLGKRLRLLGGGKGETWYSVVGIAGRVHESTLAQVPTPQVYVPSMQRAQAYPGAWIVIRSPLVAHELAQPLEAAIWRVDSNVPVRSLETMEGRIARDLRDPRFHMVMVGSFSLTAVLLSVAGIYGLMLCLIAARTREIGIRSALGAGTSSVLWTVSRQCTWLILGGCIVGVGLAAGTSRLLEGLLFGVSPLDPPTYLAVSVGLVGTALLACLLPAWRATRIEPTIALRGE